MSDIGRVGGQVSGPSKALIAIGQVPLWESFNKFGQSDVVSTSFVDVWPNASILSYLSSAEKMNIASTDINDDSGSTGAETLTVYGLDNNYLEITEDITLDGTSNVLTTNSYLRVYRMTVNSAGSSGSNEGVITATAETAGSVQSYIPIGFNQTMQCQYTVPDGKYLAVNNIEIAVQKGDQAQVHFVERKEGDVFQVKRSYNVFETIYKLYYDPSLLFSPKTDISIRALKITGAGDVALSSAYEGYLIDESQVSV